MKQIKQFINNLLSKKTADEFINESNNSKLKKNLNAFDLIILGIGAVVGTGIFTIIGQWKMFKKAGAEGYISLIPVYSLIKEMRLGGLPIYWFFLVYCAVIPLIGWIGPVVLAFWKNINLAKSFGKGTGTGVLLTFFPFVMYPILGFGKAEYVGPQGQIQVEDKE